MNSRKYVLVTEMYFQEAWYSKNLWKPLKISQNLSEVLGPWPLFPSPRCLSTVLVRSADHIQKKEPSKGCWEADLWEVLNGVGVDGVRRISNFLLFFARFLCFFRCSSFFFMLLGQEQTTAICWKKGEFHSDPVCTGPVQSFPKYSRTAQEVNWNWKPQPS